LSVREEMRVARIDDAIVPAAGAAQSKGRGGRADVDANPVADHGMLR
jgi:hypothetical protein